MISVGSTVRVLAPFTQWFPGEYLVVDIHEHEGGVKAYILEEIGGFADTCLEVV